MGWAERGRAEKAECRVGICKDEDRRKMDEVVQTWLKAWQGTPGAPCTALRRPCEERAVRRLEEASRGADQDPRPQEAMLGPWRLDAPARRWFLTRTFG